ncbi:poly(3-hydroxyalkanoate) depolymerase [Pseudonocardia sp. C8]|uniref:poly(3-hydroxyalkanoate) depolymerase n=1 Tax=Pseudonocardia sp. C8 TaxID=2762759 RepID=UPI001642AA11|nr:poly(3-hydroxyalkanoate) depolymerase [Pseudonocardia sp. C8]MBC3190336.1 poly(3-hydroxyalkanoate) depolymerase [Pseudonocardia sp. C8]
MTTGGTTRIVEAGGRTLRVAVRAGEPDRTPLLLVNGIGSRLESFDPLLDRLDPARPVIRFDPPGIGGSPPAGRPYRLPGLARTLVAVLDRLGHEQVDVLGISWGGALAQQFAWTARRRCRTLVLVATGTGAVMVPARPRVLARMTTPRRHLDPQYLRRVAPEIYGGTARTDPELAARLLAPKGQTGSARGYACQLLAAAGWTSLPFLPLLRQRTLVLAGDDDPIIPLLNGHLLAALIPRARLHVYPGGHLELVARPELLAPVIDEFLRPAPTAFHTHSEEDTS